MIADTAPSAPRVSLVIAVLAAAGLGALLWHLLYRALPHSFDPMIYARSLWGIAHGDYYNPVLFAPTFGIHGQFIQFLLVPFTWFAEPAAVLIAAQSIAFGATLWMAATAFAGASPDTAPRERLVAAGTLLAAASPLIVNAFFFDVRPDLLGVPLVVAGLLRVERRGDFDAVALTLLLGSLAVREDYAILVCPALLLAPVRGGIALRGRAIAAAAALAYLAFYLFVFRQMVGGAGLVEQGFQTLLRKLLDPGADAVQRSPLPDLIRYKIEILVIAAASMGAFVLRAPRWLLLAAPGLLLLLAQNRMQAHVLNTHYSIFAAPALLVAGVAGYRRWAREGMPRRTATLVIAVVAAAGGFLLSSAAPGGGRYLERRFGWTPLRPFSTSVSPALPRMREALDQVPPGDGLVVPYILGPPVADRRFIYAAESLPVEMLEQGRVPDGVDWVALLPQSWDYGRRLVQRGDFALHSEVDRAMVLLRRRSPDESRRVAPGHE